MIDEFMIYALIKKHLKGSSSSTTIVKSDYKVIEQKSSKSVWEIKHDMSKFPNVIIVDSGDNVVVGDINYIDENNLTVTFSNPFSGKAILS